MTSASTRISRSRSKSKSPRYLLRLTAWVVVLVALAAVFCGLVTLLDAVRIVWTAKI